jgi:predicted DNA-binding transcriptional regulator AlpA
MTEQIISIKHFARMAGLSARTLERMIVAREVPLPIRLSPGRRGFVLSEIEAWLEQRKAERDQRAA